MRRFLFLAAFFFSSEKGWAQAEAPATYAVVVGISTYANKGITKLRFANRDAQAFADYLRSKAGGLVPEENIRLLIDQDATTASVYDALSWLTAVCKQNDVVYFYFAGHGDMENQTMYKLGFLLTYNTPRTNYINNAVRIEDLNNFANTLSTKNKARVVLITDACHSGTLAGNDYRGNYLVGEQLRTRLANEIRITSCGPNELAMEHEAWGGGRGVFSFYFINGLIGFADKEQDGIVRLNDMRSYLDSAFAHDSLLIIEKHKQTPILKGNEQVQLSKTDIAQMNRMQQQGENLVSLPAPVVTVQNREASAEELVETLFSRLHQLKLDTIFDFEQLSKLPASIIAEAFLKKYDSVLEKNIFSTVNQEINLISEEISKVRKILQEVKLDDDFKKTVETGIVVLIHNKGQEVLNAYLDGDVAELERRRYYNASNNSFDSYPYMFATARRLLETDHFLYKILEVDEYYFGGVALLTKIPLTENPSALIEKAMQLELKALALEKDAPYIYNVIGTLHFYKSEFEKAELNYRKATELAPQWAVPWSNLQALYTVAKQYQKAVDAYSKAKELKPDFSDVYVNNGILQEQQRRYLFAEEQFRNGIFYNSRHYLPFERLAFVYNHTGDYALADSFYYEADIRKRGYHFQPFFPFAVSMPQLQVVAPPVICSFDSSNIRADDVYAWFLWGLFHYKKNNYTAAEEKWKHVIQLDRKNPLAFHYLGVMMWQQKRFMELDIILQYAVKNYLPADAFEKYVDSVKKRSPKATYSDCGFISFEAAIYKREEDHYYLANAYEQWNHYEEAGEQYRTLVGLDSSFIGSYMLLWQMLERIGRFNDAEKVILAYKPFNRVQTDYELAAFYRRVTAVFPYDGYWNLKAGEFFYSLAKQNAAAYRNDRKTIFPDATEPGEVIDKREKVIVDEPFDQYIPGINTKIFPAFPVEKPMSEGISFLLLADSLLGQDDKLTATINDKIGDLYTWQGVPLYASVHYQKSVEYFPLNSAVRLKLIDACNTVYKYTLALEHLDTLKNRHEINFEKQLLLAKYYMHNSRFSEAEQLLSQAKEVHPYKIPELVSLYGRLYMLSGEPKKAIEWYEQYLQLHPGDSLAMYSISRMYAYMKNHKKAMEWLQKAMNNGFVYEWVLKSDPLMNQLRRQPQWNAFMKKQVFKTYPPPVNTYPRSTP